MWSKEKCWSQRKGAVEEKEELNSNDSKNEFGREILCASTPKSSGYNVHLDSLIFCFLPFSCFGCVSSDQAC